MPAILILAGFLLWLPCSHSFAGPWDTDGLLKRTRASMREQKERGLEASKREPAKLPPKSVRRMLDASHQVFQRSEEARTRLSHLIELVDEKVAGNPDWIDFKLKPGLTIGRAFGVKRISLRGDLEYWPPLQCGEVVWHEAQHVYDRARLIESKERHNAIFSIIFPLETEQRGYVAGCLFFNEGMAAGVGDKKAESKFPPCRRGFDIKGYSCGFWWSAESVLKSWDNIQKEGPVSVAAIEHTLEEARKRTAAPEAPKKESASRFRRLPSMRDRVGEEYHLLAYCEEFERAERGNPLSMEGFEKRWDLTACL